MGLTPRRIACGLLLASCPLAGFASAQSGLRPVRKAPGLAGVSPLELRPLGRQKAGAPIRIQLVTGPSYPGGRQKVWVVVTPMADAERLEVEVDASRGLVVAGGPAAWTGVAMTGRPTRQALLLEVRGPGERRLVVTAALRSADEEERAAVALYAVAPGPRLSLEQAYPGARKVKRPDGKSVLELPGEVR
jgi:hypothetical protein